MRYLVLVLMLVIGFVTVNGQVRGRPQPTPTPEDVARRNNQDNISRRSENLRLTENLPITPDPVNNKMYREKIRPLYRKPNKKERKLLAPNAQDENQYAAFLKQKRTGLIKLVPDQGCDKTVGVVVSSEHCLKYSMPGAGASYSFRYNNYRIRFLGDLQYTGKLFQSVGVLTHGIFVNIGDVPMEEVGLRTKGVAFLQNVKPAGTYAEATDLIAKLEKGINDGGFVYKNNLPVAENTTYVLRSIAYRGQSIRSVEGVAFDELKFDKRKDVTVAFRIIRTGPDKVITVLWKELASKKSPKIKE